MSLGAPGTYSNTCNSDSGGPLFVDFGSGEEVVGITSTGVTGSCLPDDHGIDASVHYDAAFVQAQLGGDSTTACGALLPVGDASVTVIENSGTLNGLHTSDTFSVDVSGTPAVARFTRNGKDNNSFHAPL